MKKFENLDEIIKEFHNPCLNIIAGRPQTCKTSFALNIAKNISLNKNETVVVFSLEMSKDYICNNYINKNLLDTKIIVDDTPNIYIKQIQEKCRKLKKESNIDIVIIDYLQLIQTQNQNIGYLLKELANELNVCIIITSQLSKSLQTKLNDEQNIRFSLKDFGNSSQVIEYADTIMLLHKNKENILDINVAKNKYGELKTIQLKLYQSKALKQM